MTEISQPAAIGPVCAFCLSPLEEGAASVVCPDCRAVYHEDCWRENGGCAVYGCRQAAVVESRQAIEIPVSYWGREEKSCPACGREILAAAIRCRHCGATFASARPENATDYQRRVQLAERLPATGPQVVWLFICCVVPLTAPIGAFWGPCWYRRHREEIQALPPLYDALSRLGLAAAISVTAACAVLTGVYAWVRCS